MKKTIAILMLVYSFSNAENNKSKDIESILNLCGCYNVEFNFAETFNYKKDSLYVQSKNKTSYAKELVKLISQNDSILSLQHILIADKGGEELIIKHWRQDWIYENNRLLVYDGENKWITKIVDKETVSNQWTQKVFQVDDSPRYEGNGVWIHVGGKSYWESEAFAPLPRREYTTREDYNILYRRNRHEITSFGWIHDQDNDKLIKKNNNLTVLAKEKGFNTYTKTTDLHCKAAEEWWRKKSEKWEKIRLIWQKILNSNDIIGLEKSIEGVKLHQMLFNLENDLNETEIEKKITEYIK